MTTTMKNVLLCFCLVSLAACGTDTPANPKPTGASGTTKPMADEHGTPRPLGKITLNGMQIEVALLGEISGGVANIDVEFPAGAKLPEIVRGWVGIESAVGSRKAQLHKEGAGLHGHLDMPKTVPDGSQIWIEVESGGKTNAAGIDYR